MCNFVSKLSFVLPMACAIALTAHNVAHADDKSSRQAAVDLLSLMDMESLLKQGIEDGLSAQLQGTPMAATLGPKIKGFLAQHLSWKTLQPEFVALYQRSFTEDELKALIAFYKTPVGKKAITIMPKLQMQGSQIAMAKVQSHMNELMQLLQTPAPAH
jgi:hypothetical protein